MCSLFEGERSTGQGQTKRAPYLDVLRRGPSLPIRAFSQGTERMCKSCKRSQQRRLLTGFQAQRPSEGLVYRGERGDDTGSFKRALPRGGSDRADRILLHHAKHCFRFPPKPLKPKTTGVPIVRQHPWRELKEAGRFQTRKSKTKKK